MSSSENATVKVVAKGDRFEVRYYVGGVLNYTQNITLSGSNVYAD